MYLKCMGRNSTSDERRESESNERGGFSSVPFTAASKPTEEEIQQKAQADRRLENVALHLETKTLIARERGLPEALITSEEVVQRRMMDIEKAKQENKKKRDDEWFNMMDAERDRKIKKNSSKKKKRRKK